MISICIPAYEMQGRGVEMLRELLSSIRAQRFRDVEVIVSDGGLPGLKEFCFLQNVECVAGKPGAAANLNNAIDRAKGDIIKPMFQDDKFMHPDSLQKIAEAFRCVDHWRDREADPLHPSAGAEWIACTSFNSGIENWDHIPRPHSTLAKLREGENTYGSPSVMAWRRNDLRMDENLKWLFDCEFYARMVERCGVPTFVDTPIYIRQWEGQATRTLCDGHTRIVDQNEVIEKYRDRGGLARC